MKIMKFNALLAAAFLMASPALAADAAPQSIAVVNIQQIMGDSTAAKSVREQLESKQKAFQSDINKKQDALQKEQQELGKQQSVLSKDAFAEKTRAFGNKVTDAQKEVQSKKALLDNSASRAWGEFQKNVTEIVTELAKEKGFIIAIPTDSPTSQVIYADPKLDITAEVLARLNKKLPKLDVQFDK